MRNREPDVWLGAFAVRCRIRGRGPGSHAHMEDNRKEVPTSPDWLKAVIIAYPTDDSRRPVFPIPIQMQIGTKT